MSTTIKDHEIPGVLVKTLKTNKDERGFFREIVRFNDPFFKEAKNFGQWSHSRMTKNVVKAWHYHHIQSDWWYLGIGLIEAVLVDHREESPTFGKQVVFKMGDSKTDTTGENVVCVKIPPGVLHGCKVLSEEAHLFYITSQLYNPDDEGRFPYNSGPVPYDWGNDALVVENDKRTFEPKATRIERAQ